MRRRGRVNNSWIDHHYFRTYEIASHLAAIAEEPFAFLCELEEITVDDGIIDFLPNWQKESLVHKFARWVADEMFTRDTSGPYVTLEQVSESGKIEVQRRLPVDIAMQGYGISGEAFEVPPPHGDIVPAPEIGPNATRWKDSTLVADACYEYFLDLRLTQDYETLLTKISDEVFHLTFQNRVLLAGLNSFIAMHIRDLGPETLGSSHKLATLFDKEGSLKRVRIPQWVKRAVYFREHGRCAHCGRDISGLSDSIPKQEFDHIIPLARGGLNDVTNIQMLCEECNQTKSDSLLQPSLRYRRWYEMDKP